MTRTATTGTERDRSAGVKDAIRRSATRLFTEHGFDATGIRDIAADAEVNPAIVLRHFGSKEALFVITVDASGAWQTVLDGPIEDLGRRVVREILLGRERGGLNVFGTTVRASGRPDIHRSLQESMIARFVTPLISRIDVIDAELRAHLFAAQLIGLMSALVVYDDVYLHDAPIESIVERYGDALQRTLTGA